MKVFLLLFLPQIIFGQNLFIGGYFEPQYSGIVLSDKYYQLNSNKIRVDLEKELSDQVSLAANFNYITYHGKTSWNIVDYLPDTITRSLLHIQKNNLKFQFGDMVQSVGPMFFHRPERFYLDNAYIKLAFKNTDVTIGRQQISLGTGYTWNPTDLFNNKDILDPTYEQPGHNAINVEFPINNSSTLTVLYSPGEEWQNSARLLKYKWNWARFDFSAITIWRDWTFTDYAFFQTSNFQRKMYGADFVGELFGLGVWGEFGFNEMDLNDGVEINQIKDFNEIVTGVDYTFKSGFYVMGEYYRNSLATNDWQDYSLNNWMWYLSAELKTISRDQVLALCQYPATDLISLGFMTINSLSDKSSAIVPMMTFSIFQDVELTAYGNFYFGKDGRSFSTNLGNGVLARLRAYF
jgi:hypothetical protein